MELLDPKNIRAERTNRRDEAQERLQKLSDVESRLVKSVNDLFREERIQKNKLAKFITESESSMKKKREEMLAEISILEKRRTSALEPVTKLQEEAEAGIAKNAKEAERLVALETGIKAAGDAKTAALGTREANLTQKEALVEEKAADLDRREKAIATTEAKLKNDVIALKTERKEFDTEVYEWNKLYSATDAELKKREIQTKRDSDDAANLKKQNEIEAERLRNEDLAIKDKYRTLQITLGHLKMTDKDI